MDARSQRPPLPVSAAPPIVSTSTRLVRLLSQMAQCDATEPTGSLTELLGRSIGFGDSMRLSALHGDLRRLRVEPGPVDGEGLKRQVSEVRLALVRSVAESFVPGTTQRVRLPVLKAGVSLEQLAAFEPYHRFYAAHQRDFESRIQSLQTTVRDALGGASTALARLAALDAGLRDILAVPIRRQLGVVPRLLGRRFESLQGEFRLPRDESLSDAETWAQWVLPEGWLGRFFHEMQGLLLAELELRLLPVLGLVEAVDEQREDSR
jgi:hypothetical protein